MVPRVDHRWVVAEDETLRRLLSEVKVEPEPLVLTEEEVSLVICNRQLEMLKLVKKDQKPMDYNTVVWVLESFSST